MEQKDFEWIENIALNLKKGLDFLLSKEFTPNIQNNAFLEDLGEEKISSALSLQKIAARASFDTQKLKKLDAMFENMDPYSLNEILNEAKYYHYISMQKAGVEKMKKLHELEIPEDFDFKGISGLSNEVVEKLESFRPATLFAASRISGITPAALDLLHIHIKTQKKKH